MQVLLDTSAILSLSDKSSVINETVKNLVLNEDHLYIVPSTVIVETCQLLKYRFGAIYEIKFLQEIQLSNFIMETVGFEDIHRIIEILKKYSDLGAGYVDSSIVAIAERLGTNKVITLDKKHFTVMTPRGFEYFDILV